ncbi:50S ribosomal protein L6 [Candidatus Daviesbacteria bacterium]|nr:50S ribosomal protein L6 [Candidatus Daviesbacteria bacterium]
MSRVGSNPINIPNGVNVEVSGNELTVNGPKGKLQMDLLSQIKVEIEDGKVLVKRKGEDRFSKSAHGLTRSLINNMVLGVTEGWKKDLEMVGVGYRAQGGGDTLTLNVGFSHPVKVLAPVGITFAVSDNTKISVSGIDRNLVGQIAANIRSVKPPEVYKGKGIRYVGEYVRRKPGKAGKAIGGAGAAK